MSLALTSTVSLTGLIGNLIDVEVDISDGLPGYILLGLPDAALSESKDRVRAALVNSGEVWPNKKVTVSLSPAWLPKSGIPLKEKEACLRWQKPRLFFTKEDLNHSLFSQFYKN